MAFGKKGLVRFARAALAASVVAARTDFRALEVCVAAVALPMDALADCFPDQILTASLLAGHRKAVCNIAAPLLVARRGARLGSNLLLSFVFRPLNRIARTLLASLVGALGAHLVGSERSLALVAGAVNPHPDVLLNTLSRRGGRQRPVARVDLNAMLPEQGLRALGSRHCRRRGCGDLGSTVRLHPRLLFDLGEHRFGSCHTLVAVPGVYTATLRGTYWGGATGVTKEPAGAGDAVGMLGEVDVLDLPLPMLMTRLMEVVRRRRMDFSAAGVDSGALMAANCTAAGRGGRWCGRAAGAAAR